MTNKILFLSKTGVTFKCQNDQEVLELILGFAHHYVLVSRRRDNQCIEQEKVNPGVVILGKCILWETNNRVIKISLKSIPDSLRSQLSSAAILLEDPLKDITLNGTPSRIQYCRCEFVALLELCTLTLFRRFLKEM